MNTSEVAARLGTTPRALRIFIRQDPTYTNAGTGGHYDFSERDLPVMRKKFDAWNASRSTRPARVATTPARSSRPKRTTYRANNDTPIGTEICDPRVANRLSNTERQYIKDFNNFRVIRLENRLKELGLHISQMRDRPEWKKATV